MLDVRCWAISLMGPIGQIGQIGLIGLIGRIRRIGRIREIGSRAPPQPFFEGCKVRSPVSGVWSPYGRKTKEAEDMDAEVQDGQSHTGRGLEGVIYFQRPKARAKVVKKSIYTNKKHPKTCICAKFVILRPTPPCFQQGPLRMLRSRPADHMRDMGVFLPVLCTPFNVRL